MTLDNEKPDGNGIMSMDDAIRIIQSHERARQGRLRAKQIRELRLNDQRARQRANMGESKMDKSLAATIIQKYYRRHIVRREAKKFRDEEYMFLGMVRSFSLYKLIKKTKNSFVFLGNANISQRSIKTFTC
jgi:hypothetical protein